MLRKLLRVIAYVFAGLAGLLIILVLISVAPIDRTPAQQLPSYKETIENIDALEVDIADATGAFSVGFAKSSITPAGAVSTAGYGKRRGEPVRSVHDSIYVRAMVMENGHEKIAMVSADLLILPPTVTGILPGKLASAGFSLDNTYLGATHTHNSVGHWGEGATRFLYGAYNDSIVNFIADRIVESIVRAGEDMKASTIRTGSVALAHAVRNRLVDDGPEDPWLRIMEIQRSDSSRAVVVTYAAHATCLSTATLELSRDYPGVVVDQLEENEYDFAMFFAGGVGSHTGSAPGNNWECVSWMGNEISRAVLGTRHTLRPVQDTTLIMKRVPLALSEPQVRLDDDWALRSWLFRAAFREYDAFLTVLRIGDVVMLGTPCDFSGEFNAPLDSAAAQLGIHAMVTSFNGGYIGYLTPTRYHNIDHYETRLMNWYAPGTGEYVTECLMKLMSAVSDTR